LLQLAHAAGAQQAQMQHQYMHTLPAQIDFAVQEPALLVAMVRHIGVLVCQHRPAREQGIAVLPMAGDRIAAVYRRVVVWRQKISLALLGPVRKKLLLAPVELAHFLQTHQIRVKAANRLAQIVNLQTPRRTQAAHPFVDVVAHHTKNRWHRRALRRQIVAAANRPLH